MNTRDLTISSGTYSLPATLHLPKGTATAAYVLHSATGVPQRYYTPFAEWVAAQGYACLTYSYRSDGPSVAGIKTSKITMSDWGITDQNAALETLIDTFPDTPIRVIGHSLGGFMTMFHDHAARIERLSAVCSGPAFWRRSPPKAILRTLMFWYVLGPLSTALLGYGSKRLLGASEHIPKHAFHQWKRWCTNPDLHKPDWGKTLPMPDETAFQGALNLVAISDDVMIPPPVVADLARFYSNANSNFTTLTPAQAGIDKIGHLAVFRPRAEKLWPQLL